MDDSTDSIYAKPDILACYAISGSGLQIQKIQESGIQKLIHQR